MTKRFRTVVLALLIASSSQAGDYWIEISSTGESCRPDLNTDPTWILTPASSVAELRRVLTGGSPRKAGHFIISLAENPNHTIFCPGARVRFERASATELPRIRASAVSVDKRRFLVGLARFYPSETLVTNLSAQIDATNEDEISKRYLEQMRDTAGAALQALRR